MSLGALRFLHAANARLDAPPRGTGPLTGDARRVAEDATLIAFERLADACVEHDADFLLLTGETFDAAPTLRARRTLLSALDALSEFGIMVYWEQSPGSGWRGEQRALPLPANVVLLRDDDSEPVAFVKEGRVAAIIGPVSAVGDGDDGEGVGASNREGPIRIGWVPHGANEWGAGETSTLSFDVRREEFDYLGFSSEIRRTARPGGSAMVHSPGGLQGLSREERGPRGASLIAVGEERDAVISSVPLAPLRWEECRIGVDSHLSENELIERMQFAMLELERAPTDELRIVRWVMVGSGPLFETLAEPGAAAALLETIDLEPGSGAGVEQRHQFEFRPRRVASDDPLVEELISGWDGPESEEFNAVVDELEERAAASDLSPMAASLERVSRSRAQETAGRLGREWLA
ncbi:MAG: hypothetical protein DWQ34_24875 [Planctomycetota bacterium]|nr:MAG: hypothetical protein DWQ29_20895 [Planctomycetota bacterium]REJ87512.1 MAG: hypothetical protein DWQ34_24875 [Planctomycetota bacterium]REK28253.1 MAG: hypothetical protein DWQ41_06180 [Planctomycetota bacterium]REK32977.1 MAG: hypothetical protein DWQ45_15330 [Planctomycetota bacterium]